MHRCAWAGEDPLYIDYHDREWGVPITDDRLLFEFLILEGAQAGLSWITILRKREHYRRAFDGFDPEVIARYGPEKIESLLADPGIVRNRLKVKAAITNAEAFLRVRQKHGSFASYIWQFVGGEPIVNNRRSPQEVPASTAESEEMSAAMKKAGFRFVGPTICYAFMQAVGLVDDHTLDCFRHGKCRPE